VTDGEILHIYESHFHELVAQQPGFALKVMRTVVQRVRRTCPPLSAYGVHNGHRH
jgi:CRP-like cAMP-binding protein